MQYCHISLHRLTMSNMLGSKNTSQLYDEYLTQMSDGKLIQCGSYECQKEIIHGH